MNVSTAQSSSSGALDILLSQGTVGAAGALQGAPAPAGPSNPLPSGGQALSAGVQTAASLLQTASGYLGQIGDVLSQMAGPAGTASGSFSSLQAQLRGIIGGSPGEIGGPEDTATAGATFDGGELFGTSGAGVTIETGLTSEPSVTVAGPNLRQGALLGLIHQDAAGTFSLAAPSSSAAAMVSGAMEQVSAAMGSLSDTEGQLGAASAATGDGDTYPSASEAYASTALAAQTILGQGQSAMDSSSGQTLQKALGLLQTQ